MKCIIIAFVIILAGFIITLIFIPIGIEPLTELYFNNHTKITAYAFLRHAYTYSFSVHNLEYMDMNYSYSIIQQVNDSAQRPILLNYGNFSLANNQTASFNESIIFMNHFGKAKITVRVDKLNDNPYQKDPNLKNISLFIHFWAEEATGMQIIITPD